MKFFTKKKVEQTLLGCLSLIFAVNAAADSVNFPSYAGWSAQSCSASSSDDTGKIPFLFHHYRGVGITPMRYTRPLDDAKIQIELFEFPSPSEAFGFYSRLRIPPKKYVQLGGEGFLNGSELVFWKGSYCAHLKFPGEYEDKKGILLSLGQRLAAQIPGDGAEPELASAFPEEELIPYSLVYESENMLGIPGLSGGFYAVYKNGTQKRAQFVVECATQEVAEQQLQSAQNFFSGRKSERRYFLSRHGIYLIGIFPAPETELLEKQIKETEKRLNRRKLPPELS